MTILAQAIRFPCGVFHALSMLLFPLLLSCFFSGIINLDSAAQAATRPATKPIAKKMAQPTKTAKTQPKKQTEIQQRLGKLESTVFLTEYPDHSDIDRLEKLEEEVFDSKNAGLSFAQRLENLENVVVSPAQKPSQPNADAQESSSISAQNQPVLETRPTAYPNPSAPVNSALSSPSASERMAEMENYLFNKAYSNESLLKRLDRIEKYVYKASKKGTVESRIRHLSNDVLGTASLANASRPVSSPSSGSPDFSYLPPPSYPPDYSNPSNQGQPHQNGQYGSPVGQNYRGPVFGQPPQQPYPGQSTNDGLPSGGNNPQTAYSNSSVDPNLPYTPDGYPDDGDSDPNAGNGAAAPLLRADMTAAVGSLEQKLFKNTYAAEALPARLTRLETRVFKQPSPELEEEERLERLIAVVAADGDNPRSSQGSGGWKSLLPFLIILPLLFL